MINFHNLYPKNGSLRKTKDEENRNILKCNNIEYTEI